MLEQNHAWLEQSSPDILKAYREQDPREPDPRGEEFTYLAMSHQSKTTHGNGSYISHGYYERQKEILNEVLGDDPDTPNFAVIGGIDGGHVLNDAVTKGIKHLVVIEPDMASFYHSLQITDWPSVFQQFERNGGTLYLHLGPITFEIKERLSRHLQQIGTYQAAHIFIGSDRSEGGLSALKSVIGCLQDCINSLGFFDDERVGFAHSIQKLEDKERFLTYIEPPWIDRPIVVCGNGPSLSKLLPQIKRWRDRMFLMSCGTTIGTLYQAGIKPDFHVEQERPKLSSNYTKLRTTQEFRDGITCIGLNVVHPQTCELFEDRLFALKANDFGAIVAKKFLPNAPQLKFVNPLASNAGVAFSTYLGFKQVYLAGIDCAYADDGQSHANGFPTMKIRESDLELPGNFRKTVKSEPLYNESKKAMEYLILSNKRTTYYNLSDGARIQGARPTKKFKPRGTKLVSKTQVLAGFKPTDFDVDRDDIRRAYAGAMFKTKSVIDSIPDKIASRDEAFFFIDHVYEHLDGVKRNNPFFWYLVKGTLSTQLVFLAGCADLSLPHFDRASAVLKELAEEIHQQIKDNLFSYDDWESNGNMPEDVSES